VTESSTGSSNDRRSVVFLRPAFAVAT
jgi:hypothetical protein